MPTDIPPITYGTFYHIYNRGNNRENIFLQERNYVYFLDLWWKQGVHNIENIMSFSRRDTASGPCEQPKGVTLAPACQCG